jgi:hypothetical protein
VWLDKNELLPGHDWEEQITKTIHSSCAFVVCLSRSSVKEGCFARKEIELAIALARERPNRPFIIPVRLEKCEVPQELVRLHMCLDIFDPQEFERLIKALSEASTFIETDAAHQTRLEREEGFSSMLNQH